MIETKLDRENLKSHQQTGVKPKNLTSRKNKKIKNMKFYLDALKNYANFEDRANRQEYWMFVLFNIIFSLVASLLDYIFGITFGSLGSGPIDILYSLALLIPSLAITVRRLHDINKSGWMILISLIPILGWIWILILLCTDTKKQETEIQG